MGSKRKGTVWSLPEKFKTVPEAYQAQRRAGIATDYLEDVLKYVDPDKSRIAQVKQAFQALNLRQKTLISSELRAAIEQCRSANGDTSLVGKNVNLVEVFGKDNLIFILNTYAHDSVDCWTRPDLYWLDETGQPTVIAGVPPDDLGPDGQRWGNPLYRWDRMAAEDYAWWTARVQRAMAHADVFRIDHFLGFSAYWGLVINYGNVSGSVRDLDPYELGEAGSLFLTRPRLADHMADAATVQRRCDDVFAAILAGELRIDISHHNSFDDIAQGHARIEARQQIGKSVAWIGDKS